MKEESSSDPNDSAAAPGVQVNDVDPGASSTLADQLKTHPIVDKSNGYNEPPPSKKQKFPTGGGGGGGEPRQQQDATLVNGEGEASVAKSPTAVATDPSTLLEEPVLSEGTWGRRPRRGAAAAAVARFAEASEIAKKSSPSTTKKTTTNKKEQDTEEEFKMAWICCECREAECLMHPDADQLLICEGSCRRLFHYPCAGLTRPPAESEPYVCHDCLKGEHLCALCQIYGTDNEDVFPCCAAKCGLFFHEACLLMREIDVKLVPIESNGVSAKTMLNERDHEEENDKPAGFFRREFRCPAHFCWTCCQKDMVEKERKQAAASRSAEKKTRGRKKSKPSNSSFGQKTGQLTIRCLVCPNSYHVTCIPPTARFNELSLLCPDHVADHKLPDVDPETSIQTQIEQKIDAKYAGAESPSRRRKKSYMKNPFFHGLVGKTISTMEKELISGFESDLEVGPMNTLFYCMPCSIRDEVHAKPPSYKHIHANKYHPGNSPEQIKHMGGTCNCVDQCDESCFNRILYVECTRDKGVTGTNCAVGKSCGNRLVGQRRYKKCKPKREKGKGWGLIVQEDVKKGSLITEYIGEVINEKSKEERLLAWAQEHPNDPNFYIMGLGKGWYVDARNEANLARFINHSCDPNAIVHTINVNGYLRNAIFALHDIPAGTFLSYDYHFETMQGDRFVCRCGSPNCRGTMKDRALAADEDKSKRQIWEAAKREYDRDKAFLEDFYAKRAKRCSQVDAMVPEWEFPSDLVSNGPQERHRYEASRGRIFLWRNARLGADFARRFDRLESKGKPKQGEDKEAKKPSA